jgi:protein-disulfide isomerase
MSVNKRNELQLARQRQEQQQRLLIVVVIAVGALALAGVLIFPNLLGPGADAAEFPFADGMALGPPDAKVLVQEFADFQCPYCRQFHTDAAERIKNEYIAAGKSVRFEYYHLIVIDGNVGGNESRRAAEASECANEQNLFWPYHALVFANQQGEGTGAFRDERLKAFAETLEPQGLDRADFNQCFDTSRYEQAVREDEALALRLGARGTPFVVVNGAPILNPLAYAAVQQAIEAELARP